MLPSIVHTFCFCNSRHMEFVVLSQKIFTNLNCLAMAMVNQLSPLKRKKIVFGYQNYISEKSWFYKMLILSSFLFPIPNLANNVCSIQRGCFLSCPDQLYWWVNLCRWHSWVLMGPGWNKILKVDDTPNGRSPRNDRFSPLCVMI